MGKVERISEIGKRISELREEAGMLQKELADELKVSRALVSAWENGMRDIKTGDIIALAAALNTNCDFLLTGVSTQNIDFSKESGLSEATIREVCKHRTELSVQDPELLQALDCLINGLLQSEHLIEIAAAYALFKQADMHDADYARFALLDVISRALYSAQTIGGIHNGVQRTAKP